MYQRLHRCLVRLSQCVARIAVCTADHDLQVTQHMPSATGLGWKAGAESVCSSCRCGEGSKEQCQSCSTGKSNQICGPCKSKLEQSTSLQDAMH